MVSGNKQGINININDLRKLACPKCKEGFTFMQVFDVRAIPALISPAGQAGAMFNQLGFACMQCGEVYTNQQLADIAVKALDTPNSPLTLPTSGKVTEEN
jgi:hypothetical protein